MTLSDVQTFRVNHHAQEVHRRFIVLKRLADAHDDDGGNPLACFIEQFLCFDDLGDNLAWTQITFQSA
ncbi:hypothetical protein D3C86_2025100 [compost metagenome]